MGRRNRCVHCVPVVQPQTAVPLRPVGSPVIRSSNLFEPSPSRDRTVHASGTRCSVCRDCLAVAGWRLPNVRRGRAARTSGSLCLVDSSVCSVVIMRCISKNAQRAMVARSVGNIPIRHMDSTANHPPAACGHALLCSSTLADRPSTTLTPQIRRHRSTICAVGQSSPIIPGRIDSHRVLRRGAFSGSVVPHRQTVAWVT